MAVELRTTNNRYYKLSLKSTEGYATLESEIDSLVRRHVNRGTVQVSLRVDRPRSAADYRINVDVLAGYREQLGRWQKGAEQEIPLATLVLLPGVVTECDSTGLEASEHWPIVRRAMETALAELTRMRADEGRAMADAMRVHCTVIGGELDQIAARAPQVAEIWRARLVERLNAVLGEQKVAVDDADVLKEASLAAERMDIAEEILRLRSHLEQFDGVLAASESAGRKLEFLTQEMLREANTIGSKAADVQIARHVIEIKTAIERLREMVQNVE